MIVPGMFVCSSFLISVCMFIVSKALIISSATVIVRGGGAIWLNPFTTVLFSVCSAVTVEWDRDYVSQLPCVRYYVFVKSSLNILVRNASPRRPMCFRGMIFNLSGPCELLFLLCFIASWA